MSKFNAREYLKGNYKKEDEKKQNTAFNPRDYLKRSEYDNSIGFDTLETDINTLAKTIQSVYDGWQTEETLNNTRSSIEALQKRVNAYQEYRKTYGTKDSADLTELSNSYKSMLEGWDDLKYHYSKYKNADDYKKALAESEAYQKELDSMPSADLKVVQTEIDDLQKIFDNANALKPKTNVSTTTKKGKGAIDVANKKDKEQKILDEYLKSVGYSSIDDIQKALNDKKVYKNKAQRVQDGIALSSVADKKSKNYDPNFDDYSAKGTALGNEETDEWYISGYKNQVAYLRNNPDALEQYFDIADDNGTMVESILDNQLPAVAAKYMEEDEAKLHDYYVYLENQGLVEKGTATKYLRSIEEELKQRQGKDVAAERKSLFSKYTFGYEAGIDQFTQGMINAFNTEDDYIPATAIQNASAQFREDIDKAHGTFGQGVYDLITTTSNMAPSILASSVSNALLPGSGAVVGATLMGTSAAGNSYQQMLNQGYDKSQARTYGTLVGISEAGLQYAFGGIGKLGGKLTGKTINAIANGVDNALGRFAIKYGMNMAAEGFEEAAQEILNPFFENLALGYSKNDLTDVEWGEVAYSGVLGALSAGLLEGGSTAVSTFGENATAKKTGANIRANNQISGMLDIASLSQEETDAYNLYTHYANKGVNAENISDLQLGRLHSMAGADAQSTLNSRKSTAEQKASAKNTLNDLAAVSQNRSAQNLGKDAIKELYGNEEGTTALIEEGLESGENTESHKLAIELKAKVDAGETITEVELAKLADANTDAYKGEVKTDAEARLIELGETNAKELAQIVAKKTNGELLTTAEKETLQKSKNATRVYNEINNEDLVSATENMSEGEANLILSTYDDSISVDSFMNSYNLVKSYATNRFTDDYVLEHRGKLTPSQASAIYTHFVTDEDAKTQKMFDDLKVKHRNAPFQFGSFNDSVIDYNNSGAEGKVNWNDLNDDQKKAIQVVSVISQQAGMDIELVLDGEERGFNGAFEISGNKIIIDVYAGMSKALGRNMDNLILPTLSHEITHWMKEKAPELYRKYETYVFETLMQDGKTEERILAERRRLMEKAHPGTQYTDAQVRDEVIARASEDMLAKSETIQGFVDTLSTDEKKTFIQKIKDILRDIKKWFNSYLERVKSTAPEAKVIREASERIDEQIKMWDAMLKSAIETNQALQNEGVSVADFIQKDAALHELQFNERLIEKHKDMIANNYSEDAEIDLDTLMARYNKVIDIWQELGGELNSQFLEEWNNKEGKDRAFTIFKKQSGYKYNVELSSMCKKGIALFEAIDTIVKQEVMRQLNTKTLGKAEKEILYDILKQNYEIPCAICYVEQARQREGDVIDAFLNGKIEKTKTGKVTTYKLGWNETLANVQAEMKKMGVDYTFPALDRSVATDSYTPADISMDEATQEAFFNALKKIANAEIRRYNKEAKKNRPLITKTDAKSINETFKGQIPLNLSVFKTMFTEPSSRFTIADDLLYSSMTTLNLANNHSGLYGVFNQQGGVGGYKTKQGAMVYWGDILKKSWKPSTLRDEGGVRNQSNSDFMMYTLLDHAQMYVDFTAKGYYLQAYTKVLAELKLFGLSKGKINASLIPKVIEFKNADGSVDIEKTRENAGLDEQGNPIYDDLEGINHTEAFMLLEDAEYSKSIGGVCIGYSDKHILKLLDDNRIQLIIGFHDKTNDPTKRYRGAVYAKNYNEVNEAAKYDSKGELKTVHIGFNQFVRKAENKFKVKDTINYKGKTYNKNDIPRLATDLYLEHCESKGFLPAYSRGETDFSKHPNYYKLLADFSLYDINGNYAPHQKVEYNMPDQVPFLDKNGNKAYMPTKDYIKKELEKELSVRDSLSEALADKSENGIIPQFVKRVNELHSEDTQFADRDTNWNNIESIHGLEGYSVDEVINITKSHIQGILEEYGEYAEIISVRPYGSRAKGTAKTDSDLDIVVQYEGDIREDDMFNMLNEEESKLYIEGVDVDINPIRAEESGDMEDYLGRVFDFDKYDQAKLTTNKNPTSNPDIRFSDRDTLGNKLSEGQMEYFKDSKARDEYGNLLVLYHGTPNGGFFVFDPEDSYGKKPTFLTNNIQTANSYIDEGKNHNKFIETSKKPEALRWLEGDTTKPKGKKGLYKVYANVTNPLIVDCKGGFWNNIPFGENEVYKVSYVNGEVTIEELNSGETKTVTFTERQIAERTTVIAYFERLFNKEMAEDFSKQMKGATRKSATNGMVLGNFTWDSNRKRLALPQTTNSITRMAKKQGYDGVIFKNIHDHATGGNPENFDLVGQGDTVVAVFDSNQIKDVNNTNPTENKDIRYADRDTIDDLTLDDLMNLSDEAFYKLYDNLGLEDWLLEDSDVEELSGGEVSIDDISEKLNVEPKKIEILIRRNGLGTSHIEENHTAVMTQKRIDQGIKDSGAKFHPTYARRLITKISPKDFIDLTVLQKNVDREKFDANVEGDSGSTMKTFNYEGALKNSATPYLCIDTSTGQIIGHNGRHRIRALEMAGIESVEIEVELYDEDGDLIKYNAETIPDMAISSQFDTAIETHISNIIPLNEAHRDEIEKAYGEKVHQNAGVMYADRNIDLTENDLTEYMRTGKQLHTRNKKQRMLEAGKKPILTSSVETKNFISDVIRGKAQGEVRAFKKVGKRLADAIRSKRNSLDMLNRYLELNADELREAYKRHSSPKEQGDIPLTEQDFESIPEYLDEFDGVLSVNTYNNKIEVHLYKETEDGYVRILTVVSNERNSLQVSKLIGISKEKFEKKYAKKIERNIGSPKSQNEDSNPSTTARHTADVLSKKSIPQLEEKVKKFQNADRDSVTAEEDAEYMDAYFDGDDDLMQELVDRVANRLGYKYKAYHRTENAFTVFDLNKARKTSDIQGFFFSADKDAEREYGSVRYDTYLKMNNPYIVDSKEKMNAIPLDRSKENAGVIAREWLINNGYDGVIRKAEFYGAEADEYIVFDSTQIKSAEPMTFEDDEYGEGDVIPLSQRFNESNEDIRYADRDEVDVYKLMGENERLVKENENFKADVERLKERLKIEKQVTHGNYFNENQINAVAGHLRKIANTTYDKVELMKQLKDLYSYIAHTEELSWEDVFSKSYSIAKNMLTERKDDIIVNDYFKDMLKDFRTTPISFNENQIGDAQYLFGKNYNRFLLNKFKVTKDGKSLDQVWKENWAPKYGFDTDISDTEIVNEMYKKFEEAKQGAEIVAEYNEEETARWLANEIYNQYWNVSPIRTTADRYDKRIKQLNAEHRNAMRDLRDNYNNRIAEQKKADREKYQERYKKLAKDIRERKDKEIAEVKKLGQERMAKYKENAERKTKIQSITSNSLTLNKWLTTNSKDYHIHENMKAPVIALLQAIDFSSKRMLDKNYPTKQDIYLSKALSKVKDMMADATNLKEGLESLYGHDMDEELKALVESVDNIMRTVGDNEYVLNRMSLEELKTLDKLVRTIKHTVTKLNKFHTVHHNKGIVNLAHTFMAYGDKLGKIKKQDGRIAKHLKFRNCTPYYYFKRLGEAGELLFEAFQDGWDKLAFNSKQIIDFTNEVYTNKEVQEWTKETEEFTFDINGESRTFEMSIAQIMALHCVAKQEDAKRHLLSGGMTLSRLDKKGNVVADYENIPLGVNEINSILARLEKWEGAKEVADKLQEFMNTVCSDWGNEISMARFGVNMFGMPDYFPIKVSPTTIPTDNTKEFDNASLFRLLNMSFTKSRNEYANQSIEIGDIFDIFAQHTTDMAKYNALALPVLDFNKFYSIKGKDDITNAEYGVDRTLRTVYGNEAVSYVKRFVRDINGSQNVSRDAIGKTFFKNAKVAAVAANLRVVLLQPTAFFKASAVLDNKYLLKAGAYMKVNPISMKDKYKKAIAKAEKYCGIAQWKALGYYDTDISKGIAEKVKHLETFKDKVIEKSLKGAELADKLTFGTLWTACEFEIRDTRKDLEVGSEEFNQAIAKRLREVIYATQVVDSTMTRTDMMRSSDTFDKMLTTFGSEPAIAYNMLMDMVMQYSQDKKTLGKEEAKKKNGKKIRKVIAAYTITNVVAALVESGFDAYRDDDDDEEMLEQFMVNYLKNFSLDMSIGNKLPYIKEAYSVLQGYSSSRMDTQWMEYVYGTLTANNFEKFLKNGLKLGSNITGFAFYNLYRDLMATLYNLDILDKEDIEDLFS